MTRRSLLSLGFVTLLAAHVSAQSASHSPASSAQQSSREVLQSGPVIRTQANLVLVDDPAEFAHASASGLPLHQEIDLPSGDIFLPVAVHDLPSGRIGSMEIPVHVQRK